MPGFSDPIIGGGGVLIRAQIQSENYPGPGSWALLRDGSAFLSGAVIAGDLESDNFVTGPGGDGYRLEFATGIAEFNQVTVRGIVEASTVRGSTLTTATTGARVEIGTGGDLNYVRLFHGDGSELESAILTAQRGLSPDFGILALVSPKQNAGADPAALYLSQRDSDGATQANLLADTTGLSGALQVTDGIAANGTISTGGAIAAGLDISTLGNLIAGGSVSAGTTLVTGGAASIGTTLQVAGTAFLDGAAVVSGVLYADAGLQVTGIGVFTDAVTLPRLTADLTSGFGDGTWVAGTWYSITPTQNWSPANDSAVWLVVIKIRDNGVGSPERTSTGVGIIAPAFWNANAAGRGIVSVPIDRHNVGAPLTIDVSAAPGPSPRALQVRPSATFVTSGGGAFEVKLKRLI